MVTNNQSFGNATSNFSNVSSGAVFVSINVWGSTFAP
jgi:hypothetical protein